VDFETFSWLLSPPGQALLEELAARELREADALRAVEDLRRRVTPEQARAALEVAFARRRGRAKFPSADQLYFTREALEQASAGPVAAHRAARLAVYGHVADLCCGAGADALAIAAVGTLVTAVDRDPLRLALCRANAAALGLSERITTVELDLLAESPPLADVLFCDPGRRAGGRRRYSADEYEPPLAHVLGWRARTPALGVKLAPGIDRDGLPADAEVEFVSLAGELKETALWCGPLATTTRRATLLAVGADGLVERHTLHSDEPVSPPSAALSEPAAFLYEPDPAVIRAGLVTDLGARIGAAQLDAQIAYLTAPDLVATPFARAWPVLSWMPFRLKGLRARLRELGAGAVTVKKRGSPLDTDALARQLSGDGGRELVVVLTQVAGQPVALICNPPVTS
jgi:hypothetical protein